MSNLDQPLITEGLPIITLNNVVLDSLGKESYGNCTHILLVMEDDNYFYGWRVGQEADRLLVGWPKVSWRWANKGYWDAKNEEIEHAKTTVS